MHARARADRSGAYVRHLPPVFEMRPLHAPVLPLASRSHGAPGQAIFGWLTPVLSYVMSCMGAALGLRCTVRALGDTGRSRRNWLVTAVSAIGTGMSYHRTGRRRHTAR
ncbi:hypothetical protein GCM10027075_74800 [Streptomyces heilongjiangensis]